MKRRYTVLLERVQNSFRASVPDLPSCVATAKSRRSVLKLIEESISRRLAAMAADGQVVPEPVHDAAVVEIEDTTPAPSPVRPPFSGPRFDRYIGIDYSGAKTPTSSLKGLRVCAAEEHHDPVPVEPPSGAKRYWTRRGLAEWLVAASPPA